MPVARTFNSLDGVGTTGAGDAVGTVGCSLVSWQVRLASGTMDGATIALQGRVGQGYDFVTIDTMDVDSSGSGLKWASSPIAMMEVLLNVTSITNAGTDANVPVIYGDVRVM